MSEEPQTIDGRAYAPGASFRRPARLHVLSGRSGLLIEVRTAANGVVAAASLADLKVDPPLGSAARKITFPDGLVFETDDHAAVQALTGPTLGSRLAEYEAFHPRLIVVVAVSALAAWGLWRYGLDLVVAAGVAATPRAIVEQIDAGALHTLDLALADPSRLPEARKAEAEAVFRSLVAALPPEEREQRSFSLQFRAMPGAGPNAFALPGGTVVLTDEFVLDFPEKDVVAGVIGHEIGHVIGDHGLKGLYRSLGLYVMIAFLAGDVGPILEDVLLEGNVLLSLSFSREQELAADEFGLTLSHAAGFEPGGLKLFFERIGRAGPDGGAWSWLSTHPTGRERIETMDAVIDRL